MTEEDAEAAPEDDAEEAADEATEDETEDSEGLQDGDFVRVAYTARETEDDGLVDTTSQEVAEE